MMEIHFTPRISYYRDLPTDCWFEILKSLQKSYVLDDRERRVENENRPRWNQKGQYEWVGTQYRYHSELLAIDKPINWVIALRSTCKFFKDLVKDYFRLSIPSWNLGTNGVYDAMNKEMERLFLQTQSSCQERLFYKVERESWLLLSLALRWKNNIDRNCGGYNTMYLCDISNDHTGLPATLLTSLSDSTVNRPTRMDSLSKSTAHRKLVIASEQSVKSMTLWFEVPTQQNSESSSIFRIPSENVLIVTQTSCFPLSTSFTNNRYAEKLSYELNQHTIVNNNSDNRYRTEIPMELRLANVSELVDACIVLSVPTYYDVDTRYHIVTYDSLQKIDHYLSANGNGTNNSKQSRLCTFIDDQVPESIENTIVDDDDYANRKSTDRKGQDTSLNRFPVITYGREYIPTGVPSCNGFKDTPPVEKPVKTMVAKEWISFTLHLLELKRFCMLDEFVEYRKVPSRDPTLPPFSFHSRFANHKDKSYREVTNEPVVLWVQESDDETTGKSLKLHMRSMDKSHGPFGMDYEIGHLTGFHGRVRKPKSNRDNFHAVAYTETNVNDKSNLDFIYELVMNDDIEEPSKNNNTTSAEEEDDDNYSSEDDDEFLFKWMEIPYSRIAPWVRLVRDILETYTTFSLRMYLTLPYQFPYSNFGFQVDKLRVITPTTTDPNDDNFEFMHPILNYVQPNVGGFNQESKKEPISCSLHCRVTW